MNELLLRVGGDEGSAADCAVLERKSPADGVVVSRVAAAKRADVEAAIATAHAAYIEWSKTGPSHRRMLLLKAADELEKRADSLVEAMKDEVGSAELWARFNVMAAAELFREAASMATQLQGETIPTDKPGTLSMTLRQPVGVILSIVPWNGPIVLAARAIAYPLVCGNTVIFRASEMSPRVHALVVEAVHAAGFPQDSLKLIVNLPEDAPELIEAMIADPRVRRVNFTGSTRVGRIIGELCGRHLKKSVLELGDKSPLVVLCDADVEAAVNAAIFGAFLYQGQICMSTERLIVHETIADEFVERLAARVMTLKTGDPRAQAACALGPVVSLGAADRLNRLLDDAVSKGAKILAGGRAQQTFMDATVLDHVTRDMAIYREEAFGPILQVIRIKNNDEAVRVANDPDCGLSAALHGRDMTATIDVAMRIETGSIHINGATVAHEAQAPYGGTRNSGWGRFNGRAVIDEFTEIKWLTIEPPKQPYPLG
ncbi:aldehyde dehydrogenase [Xanthobacter autotrophicus]|uniref:aldehyde dehydrogenase n=1 Tax=Xanthobacter autotrophicus TaxID=280 RepID=UPI003727C352